MHKLMGTPSKARAGRTYFQVVIFEVGAANRTIQMFYADTLQGANDMTVSWMTSGYAVAIIRFN